MQSLSKKLKRATIPEYYLYWTYSSNEFLKHPLYTYDNKPLSILFPGTRNSDNGPDFNGALLQIGDTILRGDVEFHIHWQDWFRHGHHFDRRYDQVILHILWEHPEYLPESLSRRFSHLILSNYLNLPFSSWLKAMEQMQFDKPPIKINSSANLPNLSTLENIAWKRFLRKCEELRFWIENRGWEETLYLGLAQVLGYSKNSSAFVELLLRFPPSRLLQTVHPMERSPIVFWILLCEQAGLLSSIIKSRNQKMPQSFYLLQNIRNQFAHLLPYSRLKKDLWNFSRLRPPNNPYFRLAGFSQILFQYQNTSLFQMLAEIFIQRLPLKLILPEIESRLRLKLSPNFQPLLTELLHFHTIPQYTMGKTRCYSFILNVLLPLFFLYAQNRDCPGFACYIEDLFFHFPAIDNIAFLKKITNDHPGLPRNRAFVQQAILEIWRIEKIKKTSTFPNFR